MEYPIRVIHVVGSLGTGGIQSYLMELYRNIDRNRIQFDFLVHNELQSANTEEIAALGGKIYYVNQLFSQKRAVEYYLFVKKFFAQHPENKIVHGHMRSIAALYLMAAKKNHRFTIAHSHATSNGIGVKATLKDIMQFPTRYIADYFMGCSQKANEWMFGKKIARSDKCIVLNNGINIRKFIYSEAVRKRKREELNLSDNDFAIGNIGRLVEVKNQRLLIESMPNVLKLNPKTVLLLVGDGPMKKELESLVSSYPDFKGRIRLLGNRTDVAELLNAFDLFVLPSKKEGLGIAAIEAQANGLDVLVSDSIPAEAFITDHISVVKSNKDTWWKKMLEASLNNKPKREMGIPETSDYNISKVAHKLENIYVDATKRSQ